MSRKYAAAMATGVAVFLGTRAAPAVPITFSFAGQIDSVEDLDSVWGGRLQVGSPFSGSYTFDSEAPPRVGDPDTAFYDLTDMLVQVGGETISTAGTSAYRWIQMINLAADGYAPGANNFQSGGFYIYATYLSLTDSTGQAFADTSLPCVPLDLGLFQHRGFYLGGRDAQALHSFTVRGTVTSLTPEPAAWAFVLLGAFGVFRRR